MVKQKSARRGQRSLSLRNDIIHALEDVLKTAVAPIEGPIDAAVQEGKDLYKIGKDIFAGDEKSHRPTIPAPIGKAPQRPQKPFGSPVIIRANRGRSRTSLSNMPGRRVRPDAETRTREAHAAISAPEEGGEVEVVPPPRKLAKIHPDYFTVTLPYVTRGWTSNEASFAYAVTTPFAVIRLNSIYDPLKAAHAGAGAPTFNSNVQPQGRNIWESHFKYYRVLKTHVKLTFISTRHQSTNARPFDEAYVVGYELIDEDQPVSNNTDMFLMTKHAKREILPPCNRILTFDSTGAEVTRGHALPQTKVMTFTYTPGMWNHHVEELGIEERWTPILQNPAIDHDMAIRIMHLDATTPATDGETVGVLIQLSYEVQFREATDTFFKTYNTEVATYGGAGEDPADD